MKKLFLILLCLVGTIIPSTVFAKSYSFNYYCDKKQDMGDGKFYMTCHIAVKTDFDVNHIEGNLILKNVTLEDVRTNSDWVNNNGKNTKVDMTSRSNHNGSFSVADLVFTGNLSDTECEASFEPIIAENITNQKVCTIIDNEYYGSNGTIVTEEKYYEQCGNYVCAVIDNKYYFNSEGKSVSYEEYQKDCANNYVPETPNTGINYGYIILPLGILSIVGILKFTKKNSKIYKI